MISSIIIYREKKCVTIYIKSPGVTFRSHDPPLLKASTQGMTWKLPQMMNRLSISSGEFEY